MQQFDNDMPRYIFFCIILLEDLEFVICFFVTLRIFLAIIYSNISSSLSLLFLILNVEKSDIALVLFNTSSYLSLFPFCHSLWIISSYIFKFIDSLPIHYWLVHQKILISYCAFSFHHFHLTLYSSFLLVFSTCFCIYPPFPLYHIYLPLAY